MNQSTNFLKALKVFRKNYKLVPLETFGSDPYKTLISTLMSSRTKDTTTLVAAQRLFTIAPDIYILSKLSVEEISKLIYPVGFYKTKAKHIKRLSEIIIRRYTGQVPKTRKALMTLPGVGRKTTNLVLNRAFGIPAIAVDTHVHKISNILGWVKSNTPEQTEKQLMKVIPRKYWQEINLLMVSIGQQYQSDKKIQDFLQKEGLL